MPRTSAAVKNRYNDKAYDRITVIVPKGDKDTLKSHAEKYQYKSLNDFINRAISAQIERDQAAEPDQPEQESREE